MIKLVHRESHTTTKKYKGMKNTFKILLLGLLAVFFQFCEPDDIIDKNKPAPYVSFAFDTLYVDLNKIDNPPLVAFVKSYVGLANVSLKIKTVNSTYIEYKTYDEFFNDKAFSLSEGITFNATHRSLVVIATDKAGKTTESELPLKITQLKSPPKITFSVDSIVYNELVGGEIPYTVYDVESDAGLTSVEMFFATADGQVPYDGEPAQLTGNPKTYNFSKHIEYTPAHKGFIVKATDVYGQVGIQTLPFKYIEVPAPVIVLQNDTVITDNEGNYNVVASVTAQGGIATVEIIKYLNTGAGVYTEVIDTKDLNAAVVNHQVNYNVNLSKATAAVVVKATNRIGKETSARITTVVGMRFAPAVKIGGHRYNLGLAGVPDVYPLLSLKDMKTYSMDYYTASKANTGNIDIKMYVNYSTAEPWPISIVGNGNGVTTHDNMFKDSKNIIMSDVPADQKIDNDTRFRVLTNFDFDNATSTSINAIDPTTITELKARVTELNTVIAFKTAANSTSGGGRVGLMKEIRRIPVTPPPGYGAYVPQYTVSVYAIKFPKP